MGDELGIIGVIQYCGLLGIIGIIGDYWGYNLLNVNTGLINPPQLDSPWHCQRPGFLYSAKFPP